MNRFVISLILILLGAFVCFAQPNNREVFSEHHSTIYADTVTIEKPLIVNIDGIGFLTSKNDFDSKNPKRITQNSNTCIIFCIFTKPYLNQEYELPIMGLKSSTQDQLYNSGIYYPIFPKFRFSGRTKGCDVYESELPVLRFAVFLEQINYLNDQLNPFIEWASPKHIKEKKRIVKSSCPAIEYIKVTIPIK